MTCVYIVLRYNVYLDVGNAHICSWWFLLLRVKYIQLFRGFCNEKKFSTVVPLLRFSKTYSKEEGINLSKRFDACGIYDLCVRYTGRNFDTTLEPYCFPDWLDSGEIYRRGHQNDEVVGFQANSEKLCFATFKPDRPPRGGQNIHIFIHFTILTRRNSASWCIVRRVTSD